MATNSRTSNGNRRPNAGRSGNAGRRSNSQSRPRNASAGRSGSSRPRNYSVQQRNINFSEGSGAGRFGLNFSDPRTILVLAGLTTIALLILVVLFNSVRGCVSNANTQKQEEAQQAEQQQQEQQKEKPHVASGISDTLSSSLKRELDESEKLATIASEASDYPETLVRLALAEPAARDFVLNYKSSSSAVSAPAFGEGITKGTVPEFYSYDPRWGYTTFAGGPFAITGTAPTALAMAYMGLTGVTTENPLTLAALANSKNYFENGDVSPDFFIVGANTINGLSISRPEITEPNITAALGNGAVIIVRVRDASAFGDMAHYILVAKLTENGAAQIIDPMSATNTKREWAVGTIVAAADKLYAVTGTSTEPAAAPVAPIETTANAAKNTSGTTANNGNANAGSNAAASSTTGGNAAGSNAAGGNATGSSSSSSNSNSSSSTSTSSEGTKTVTNVTGTNKNS